eukprot:GDKK01045032.1.p1 GENE.GDKK01045032.1~~GDKK01045032.1.p1  ORF type:complete len:233 (+),score=30.45 GDKK01045032.1:1-699(+)
MGRFPFKMQYISGHLGNAVIAQQPYVSKDIPEWKGNSAYAPMYFTNLKAHVGGDLHIPPTIELKHTNEPIKHSSATQSDLTSKVEKTTNISEALSRKMLEIIEQSTALRSRINRDPKEVKISQIVSVTGCDSTTANKLLVDCNDDERRAIQKFFDEKDKVVIRVQVPSGQLHDVQMAGSCQVLELRQRIHQMVWSYQRPFILLNSDNNQYVPENGTLTSLNLDKKCVRVILQ